MGDHIRASALCQDGDLRLLVLAPKSTWGNCRSKRETWIPGNSKQISKQIRGARRPRAVWLWGWMEADPGPGVNGSGSGRTGQRKSVYLLPLPLPGMTSGAHRLPLNWPSWDNSLVGMGIDENGCWLTSCCYLLSANPHSQFVKKLGCLLSTMFLLKGSGMSPWLSGDWGPSGAHPTHHPLETDTASLWRLVTNRVADTRGTWTGK